MTLILGGIPFVVPFFGSVIGLKLGVERLHAWLTRGNSSGSREALVATLLGLAIMALIVGLFVLVDRIDLALRSGRRRCRKSELRSAWRFLLTTGSG